MNAHRRLSPALPPALIAILALLLSVLALPRAAAAEGRAAVGFSNLVLRLDGEDSIGIAGEDFRIHLVEAMRKHGLNAVGAESLVFGKDHTEAAEYMLGGTIRELECLERRRGLNCRIGIEWQLLDVAEDRVVYKVVSRYGVIGATDRRASRLGLALVLGALDSLVTRRQFREAMAGDGQAAAPSAAQQLAGFAVCPSAGLAMPSSAPQAMEATAVVRSGKKVGSGFFISPDGLMLTAAHVVGPRATLKLRDGAELAASLVRFNADADVALLRVKGLASKCLPLSVNAPAVGADIYVIGAPAGEQLAFSLTRGIVSSVRKLDGQEVLQTDASINPGNSGGPLLDAGGHVVALASFKVAGEGFEGLAFGVPMAAALKALGLAPADHTDPSLLSGELRAETMKRRVLEDTADPIPSLDPEADALARQRVQLVRQREAQVARQRAVREQRRHATPGWLKAVRWSSFVVATGGLLVTSISAAGYVEGETTRESYEKLRRTNDVGWVLLGVGSAGFLTSFAIAPAVARPAAPLQGSVTFGPDKAAASLAVSF